MDPGPEMGSLTNLRMKDIEVLEMVNITDLDPESLVDLRMWDIEVLEMVNTTDLDPESIITDLDPESITDLDPEMRGIEVLEMVNITDADPEMGSFTDIRMWSIGVPDPEMIKGEVQEAMKMLSLNIQVEVLNNLKNFTIIDYVG